MDVKYFFILKDACRCIISIRFILRLDASLVATLKSWLLIQSYMYVDKNILIMKITKYYCNYLKALLIDKIWYIFSFTIIFE